MSSKPTIPSGTRDFGPDKMVRRHFIFDTIKPVFEKFAFMPIETPAMENLKVLTGKYGDEGDQLLFKVLNSGNYLNKSKPIPEHSSLYTLDIQRLDSPDKSILNTLTSSISDKGLRYDLTVPFARFVVMNQNDIQFPFKRYQIQPVWRADRPQHGRYREFYQCDADVVGTESLICEAEIILMMTEVFKNLGIVDYDIKINNRKILSGIAEAIGAKDQETDVFVAIDKLDKIGIEKVLEELDQRGIEKSAQEKLKAILSLSGTNVEKIVKIKSIIDSETGQHGIKELEEVFDILSNFGDVPTQIDFDITLARGLSYYTGAIFEVKANNTTIGSISGGGRYDNLTGTFGLQGVSGVGFSFGVDRIYDVMEELDLFGELKQSTTKVMLTNFDEDCTSKGLAILTKLRSEGINAEMYPKSAKMKKQMNYADKKGHPYVLFLGPEEFSNNLFKLKNMESGEQKEVSIEQAIDIMK